MSKIVDFEGHVLAEAAPGGESMVANASLDIAALRARRLQGGMTNTLARVPMQAFASTYRGAGHAHRQKPCSTPRGAFERPEVGELRAGLAADIERLAKAGLL